jgi:hypothetical protein
LWQDTEFSEELTTPNGSFTIIIIIIIFVNTHTHIINFIKQTVISQTNKHHGNLVPSEKKQQ